jgi:hypothetical protein
VSAASGLSTPWATRAVELAAWTERRLVNRTNAWGAHLLARYRHAGEEGTPQSIRRTAPAKARRGKVFLTTDTIIRHFRGRDPGHVIGLHSTSPANTSLWAAVDVDYHGEAGPDPAKNLAAALGWYAKLTGLRFRPFLTDSNGRGGYHVLVPFTEAIPTAKAFAFGRWIVSDFAEYRLTAPPETFPKQAAIEEGCYGNWLRLPGRHHTHNHWARVWNGNRWLEGGDAIDFILSLAGDHFDLIPVEALSPQPAGDASRCRAVPRRTIVLAGGDPASRIMRYRARLPNLCEGQGRDNVAYNFAAFLVRDLKLFDADALPWLSQWDAGNSPPLGEARLREIMRNAHTYGQRDYDCGLQPRPMSRGRRNRVRVTVEI